MATKKPTIIVFDLLDTLLSTEPVTKEMFKLVGGDQDMVLARQTVKRWRQCEHEATTKAMREGKHINLGRLAPHALRNATREAALVSAFEWTSSISCTSTSPFALPPQIMSVLGAYDRMRMHLEIPYAMHLIQAHGISAHMFTTSCEARFVISLFGSDLRHHKHCFKSLVCSVNPQMNLDMCCEFNLKQLLKTMGKEDSPSDVWFVSADVKNWRIAKKCGLRTGWIDRKDTSQPTTEFERFGAGQPTVAREDVFFTIVEILRLEKVAAEAEEKASKLEELAAMASRLEERASRLEVNTLKLEEQASKQRKLGRRSKSGGEDSGFVVVEKEDGGL